VLAAIGDPPVQEIATEIGISRPTVWRRAILETR